MKGVTEDRQDMKEGEEKRKRDRGGGLSWCAQAELYHHVKGIRGKMGLPVPQ